MLPGAQAESFGRVERRSGDQDGGQSNQRMKCRHQLGHGCHRDPEGNNRTDRAADCQTQKYQAESGPARRSNQQRGDNGDRHAGNSEPITLPGGFRTGKTAQGQDE